LYLFANSIPSPFLYRLQADGSVDESFYHFAGEGEDLLIQADGKIVTTGNGFVSRQNPDGTPDASFGNHGAVDLFAQFRALSLFETSPAVAVTPEGKVLLACSASRFGNLTEDDFLLARFNADGSLDNSFGTNGLTIIDVAKNDRVKDLLVQADGKFLLSGYTGTDDPITHLPLQSRIALLRFNGNGTIDDTFKADPLPADTFGLSVANAITSQTDGRIVIAGGIRSSGSEDMFVARYQLDPRIPPTQPPDFTLTADPATVTGERGSKVRFAITINRVGGFTGAVSIGTVLDPPKMHITTVEPSADGLTLTYTLKIKGKAKAGTYPLDFVGEDASGRQRSVTVTLIVT